MTQLLTSLKVAERTGGKINFIGKSIRSNSSSHGLHVQFNSGSFYCGWMERLVQVGMYVLLLFQNKLEVNDKKSSTKRSSSSLQVRFSFSFVQFRFRIKKEKLSSINLNL